MLGRELRTWVVQLVNAGGQQRAVKVDAYWDPEKVSNEDIQKAGAIVDWYFGGKREMFKPISAKLQTS